MDALKTLSEENANLMQEMEEAEAARNEAKAAKEQMARFKADYGKRFAHLKAALQKFRESHPENGPAAAGGNQESNPVTNRYAALSIDWFLPFTLLIYLTNCTLFF